MTLLRRSRPVNSLATLAAAWLAVSLLSSCAQIRTPASQPYISAAAPPQVQELRWSNGRLPHSLDPARAAAAPESDIVCALFEGLTEIDPTTLNALPSAAEKWNVSEDGRTWTFHLRKEGKWSNGKRVTAANFVASWKRAAAIGTRPDLFSNIAGFDPELLKSEPERRSAGKEAIKDTVIEPRAPQTERPVPGAVDQPQVTVEKPVDEKAPAASVVGVEAVDDLTLKVTLLKPDKDLPKLVSDPVFRPVSPDLVDPDRTALDANVVTNGPFVVADASSDGVVIKRSDTYWNRSAVKLDRIRFVPSDNPEAALAAYKNGDLDAITNSDFEPLALKLLTPYGDFRQTTHNALNLYEFNIRSAPFSDRRVREALAVAIDRQKIVDGEFEGTAEMADDFLPLSQAGDGSLDYDPQYARELLERAGYPAGENFPVIRLVINRNDVQQRIAKLVARMWQQNLNVQTQVIVKDASEIDAVRASGEYDLVRRGVVLPTADETVSLEAIFSPAEPQLVSINTSQVPGVTSQIGIKTEQPHGPSAVERSGPMVAPVPSMSVRSAADALYELYSIPLYSPNAYSLVKPYVHGLRITGLNSVSVKAISIDNTWSTARTGQP